MQIYYCEKCGLRIQQSDLDAGRVRITPENLATCSTCLVQSQPDATPPSPAPLSPSTTTIPAHRSASARATASQRSSRDASVGKNLSKTPVLLAAGVAVVLVLVFALSGKKEPSNDAAISTTEATRTAPAKPSNAASASDGKSANSASSSAANEPAKPPAPKDEAAPPAAKVSAPEDVRESYALRRWANLKSTLSQPGSEWSVGNSVREFIDGYGSSTPGKEAAAWYASAMGVVPPTQQNTVAGYRRNFSKQKPAEGWSYFWNANGPLGQTANYAALVWNEKQSAYSVEANAFPLGRPAAYTRAGATSVHPGNGTQAGTPFDRYVISAYTLQPGQEGKLALKVQARRPAGSQSSIELCVLVNNSFRGSTKGPATEMSGPLGTLRAGDTVYVAIGPNQDCGSDSTDLDWVIYKVE